MGAANPPLLEHSDHSTTRDLKSQITDHSQHKTLNLKSHIANRLKPIAFEGGGVRLRGIVEDLSYDA